MSLRGGDKDEVGQAAVPVVKVERRWKTYTTEGEVVPTFPLLWLHNFPIRAPQRGQETHEKGWFLKFSLDIY
ncbi:T cell receptor alpha chain [Sesbania bispinosa]|nr:T cell receptor alpha chain [Sesbania bispinosa]